MSGDKRDGSDSAIDLFVSRTYDETVEMIEEMTEYLTGQAELDRKSLPDNTVAAYAGESIRLTTRLMQVMAWLLNRRAVQNGEITAAEALHASRRLGSRRICLGPPFKGADMLPERLRILSKRSESLFRRVVRLEELLRHGTARNPVHYLQQDLSGKL